MEELKAIAEVINVGGNAALLLCAWYIRQCEKANTSVSERLARIEAKLDIQPNSKEK